LFIAPFTTPNNVVDDAADAWGWGDDDDLAQHYDHALVERSAPPPATEERPPLDRHITPATKEMTLSEKYWTSSIPGPVYKTVIGIYNDGARLTQAE
jgi:centromere/kinetochore protein ZW10